jgi:dihydroorotase
LPEFLLKGIRPMGGDPRDLLIVDGSIAEIAEPGSIDAPEAEVVQADGLVALPGLVDSHERYER